jgi:pyruvate kinase
LMHAGVRHYRIGLSKYSSSEALIHAQRILDVASRASESVELSLDLPGDKPRLCNTEPRYLCRGELITLLGCDSTVNLTSTTLRVDTPIPGGRIQEGTVITTGDGEHALKVERCGEGILELRCLTEGVLEKQRGLNVPGLGPKGPSTEQVDAVRATIESCLFRSVMLSFISNAGEIDVIRGHISAWGIARPPKLIAKLETQTVRDRVAQVARASDAVLLARGDLLPQVGEAEFYAAHERMLSSAIQNAKRTIVGTQLLDSLRNAWLPNRSEILELCRLMSAGVDGYLLSAETAVSECGLRAAHLLNSLWARYGRSNG